MTLQKGMQIGNFLMGVGNQVSGAIDARNAAQDEADYNMYMSQIQSGQNPEEIMAGANAEANAGGSGGGGLPIPGLGGSGPGDSSDAPTSGGEGAPAAGEAAGSGVGGKVGAAVSIGSKVMSAMNMKQPAGQGNINHKALMRAYTDDYKMKMQDVTFRKAQLELSGAKAKEAKAGAQTALENMDGALAMGNEKLAKEHLASAYTYVNNGENIEYDRETDKFYEMEENEETGVNERGAEVPFMGWDSARKLSKGIMEGTEFEQMWIEQDQNNKIANLDALNNMQRVVDKDGNHVGFMSKLNKNGEPDWQLSLNNTPGVDMPWSEALRSGYQLEDAYLGRSAKKASLEDVKSQTAKRKQETKAKGVGPKSSEGKLALDVRKAMPERFADDDESMQYVLKLKNAGNFAKILEWAEENLSKEEAAKFVKKVIPDIPETKSERDEKDFAGVAPEARPEGVSGSRGLPTSGTGDADVEETAVEKKINKANKVVEALQKAVKDGKMKRDEAKAKYVQELKKWGVPKEEAQEMLRMKFGN